MLQAQQDAQQSGDWRVRDEPCGVGASEKCFHGVRRKASGGEERVAEEKVKQEGGGHVERQGLSCYLFDGWSNTKDSRWECKEFEGRERM